jgi:hypothetical protein
MKNSVLKQDDIVVVTMDFLIDDDSLGVLKPGETYRVFKANDGALVILARGTTVDLVDSSNELTAVCSCVRILPRDSRLPRGVCPIVELAKQRA